jgi:hypothetical protein
MNPVHMLPPLSFLKIHFNIILSQDAFISEMSVAFGLLNQNYLHCFPSPHAYYNATPNFIVLDLIILTVSG